MPEIFRRLHPRFKTPWLRSSSSPASRRSLILLPGDVNFVGTLYSLGATLSFTVAHASLVRMRMHDRTTRRRRIRARPNLRLGGVDWPLFAIVRRRRDGGLVPRDRRAEPADALGRARLDRRSGSSGTSIYRRRFVRAPLARDRQGAARVRPRARARVPAHPRPGRPRAAVRRRARRRLQPRGRARRARSSR